MLTPSAITISGCFPQEIHCIPLSSAWSSVKANQTRVKVSVPQNGRGDNESA